MPETPGVVRAASRTRPIFFERELQGEPGLSFETAKLLYQEAMGLLALEPWRFLDDLDLVWMIDPQSGETCRCSIMGAAGGVYSFQVYVGDDSYRFFRRIERGEPVSGGDLYGSITGVSAEFVPRFEQTVPDRKLLQAMGHPKKRDYPGPIFRAFRAGYHPWYLSEREGRQLLHCLGLVHAFCLRLLELQERPAYWNERDTYPFLHPVPGVSACPTFEIRTIKAAEPERPRLQPSRVDRGTIDEILRGGLMRGGTLAVDHLYSLCEVGQKYDRKGCLRAAFVCDGDSGFAYHAESPEPNEPTGDVLVRSLLQAMRNSKLVPREVLVCNPEFKPLLAEFAQEFGLVVRVKKPLPYLEAFKKGLLERLGDPGVVPY